MQMCDIDQSYVRGIPYTTTSIYKTQQRDRISLREAIGLEARLSYFLRILIGATPNLTTVTMASKRIILITGQRFRLTGLLIKISSLTRPQARIPALGMTQLTPWPRRRPPTTSSWAPET